MVTITEAVFPTHANAVRSLFREYAGALDFSLDFQGFYDELANLPGEYAPPGGCVLLAQAGPELAGCAALRPFGDDACEMKRLYVRPVFRTRGVGRQLAERIVTEARERGYPRMLLDTVPGMEAAISLYRALGFREIQPYRPNPIAGALFFELDLRATPASAA
ncbi:MAG TPA: GNAT family N-acetyltransferase [Phycisphaerae bacterium]|nr:GNAT family N-acetyltransferase [Phycisphaerales bacterium]HRX86249.1 GNAT family N-acetyltransferase [Phycisphaerae bacterium]